MRLKRQVSERRILIYLSGIFTIDEIKKWEFLSQGIKGTKMQFYFRTMKTNIFLCLITLMLLVLTVGFWYGIPLFGLTDFFSETDVPGIVRFVSVCLSVGFCFSILCIPFHLSFARAYAINKRLCS